METQKWPSQRPLGHEKYPEKADDMNNGTSFNNLLENVERNTDSKESKNISNDSRIKNFIETAISENSRKIIDNILEEIKVLTPVELLFLYLKLPTECSNSTDPLQKPLNPLGSRSEINQTIMWIKTHLEEDPELSLPKQDVYDEYRNFCEPNKIKPLSTADFGKVMKQVYANVRPRRLGTRGNSRYCYAGLRRRFKLEFPNLADLSDKPQSTERPCSSSDLLVAAWSIVKEWAEVQLGTQFPSLHILAAYLVLNGFVGQASAAATVVTSISKCQLKGDALISTNNPVCSTKHRETQLQLQRKIQQKCDGKEHKRKLSSETKGRSKKCKVQVSTTVTNPSPTTSVGSSTAPTPIVVTPVANDVSEAPPESLTPVCDKSLPLPDFHSLQKSVTEIGLNDTDTERCDNYAEKASNSENVVVTNRPTFTSNDNYVGKIPIPRTCSSMSKVPPPVTPTKKVKSAKYKMIQPKSEPCDIASYNPQAAFGSVENRSQENLNSCQAPARKTATARRLNKQNDKTTGIKTEEKIDPLCSVDFPLTRERLISISQVDKDALDDYLGSNNSQEHEEELMKYFENEQIEQEQTTKLSQLRQLLEKNGHHATRRDNSDIRINLVSLLNSSNQCAFTKTKNQSDKDESSPVVSQVIPVNNPLQNLNARRRVSFETLHTEETVPPSPNTPRKNFSFVPISPGPVSPSGRQSKSSSTTASPFVSPRNTPILRAKNNIHQCPATSFISGVSNNSLQKQKLNKNSPKIKQETEFQMDPDKQLTVSTNVPSYMAMSAPPSPKVKSKGTSNLLQQLLNSKGRISYIPQDEVQIQNALMAKFNEPLCTEVSQLLTGSSPAMASDVSGFRSQSVPLHQMSLKSEMNLNSPLTPNSCITQFPFNMDTGGSLNNTPIPNEFNDFDTFSGDTDNINMNKILTELENENVAISEVGFGDMSLNNNLALSMGLGFTQTNNQNESDLNSNLKITPIDIENTLKFNPSRSVPGTPLPNCDFKTDVVKNYRSYPSTPLSTSETFSYSTGHDYLLNGQPVKEKLEADMVSDYLPNPGNQDIYTFNVTNADMLLGDSKNEFNFESQLSDESFGAKNDSNPILEENCVIINSYDFRNVTE